MSKQNFQIRIEAEFRAFRENLHVPTSYLFGIHLTRLHNQIQSIVAEQLNIEIWLRDKYATELKRKIDDLIADRLCDSIRIQRLQEENDQLRKQHDNQKIDN